MHLSQGSGQFLERDIRLGRDDLQQERPMRGKVAPDPPPQKKCITPPAPQQMPPSHIKGKPL
jgi:hypothetical protein